MIKKIIPSQLIDETGQQNSIESYECFKCGNKESFNKIQYSGWYYKINCAENQLIYIKKKKLGFVEHDQVDYICPKHYRKLTDLEKSKYVEVGLPYFLSIAIQSGGVFSF